MRKRSSFATGSGLRHRQRPSVAVLGTGEGHSHCYASSMLSYTQTAAMQTSKSAYAWRESARRTSTSSEIYDAFTISVIVGLEDLGFCEKGRGRAGSLRAGIGPGSSLPVNTSGGGLRYCHPGMFGIFLLIDAVRQLRGTCGDRQVPNARHAIVHGFGGIFSGNATVILGSQPS